MACGTPEWTAKASGDAVISLINGRSLDLKSGRRVKLRALWSSELPQVTELSIRYPGSIPNPQALVEGRRGGIARINGFQGLAAEGLRYLDTTTLEDGHSIVRFEASPEAVEEIKARNGWITAGAADLQVQYKHKDIRKDIRKDSVVTYHSH